MPWIDGVWVEPQQPQSQPPPPLQQAPAGSTDWFTATGEQLLQSYAARLALDMKAVRQKKQTPPTEEVMDCHGCGRVYTRSQMAYTNVERGMQICKQCIKQYITCGNCGTEKNLDTWNPQIPVNKQCDECGSPSHGLAVKQHRTFKPQSNLIKTRRDTLWPKQPQPQSPSSDSVPIPKWQSF